MSKCSISRFIAVIATALSAIQIAAADESVLPTGDSRPALAMQHFPDRVHEFVWRNWNAVPPAKIAKIISATESDVVAMAESMGLPREAVVTPEMRERGYVTLIRRNWHLLPYAQLLELLEISPEHLSVMLREEDFLWIKLGRVKPASDPIRYVAPDDAARARAAEIRRVVESDFGAAIRDTGEPRFDFVRQFREAPASAEKTAPADKSADLRIVYSYVAVFGDPLMNPKLDPYPDGLLQQLADVGINGVWLHAVLRDLAPGGDAFPEFGEHHETRLKNLRALVKRASKFGIRVFLYTNEPRAMPQQFFANRPEIAGVTSGELTAMCTSQPAVLNWVRDALAHVFSEVPGLGGVYTITASENLTNCASHGGWTSCPRCKDRTDASIITEVNAAIEEGVHRGDPNATVLVSDWGWRGHGDAPDMIAMLPGSVWLMSVSEWHLPIERGGISSTVGEYSISAVGPGPRSQAHWKVAESRGMRTGTEIQFNNTCEIASIPYLPVLDLIAEHCSNLEKATDLDAMFIGWTMGGHPSPNFQVAQAISRKPTPTPEAVLDALALDRFGPKGAPHARKAWTLTSEAFREYPFHISVIYTSPVQWGAANPLYPFRTGYSATMWGIPYDDVKGWCGPYPPDIFAAQFEKITAGWKPGLTELALAVEKAPKERRMLVAADLRYARAAAIHFQSVANQTRFVVARDQISDPAIGGSPEKRQELRKQLAQLIEAEIALARELYDLTLEDSRIGFEPSCQYFYLPLDVVEKVVNCRWLLENMDTWALPAQPA